MPTTHDLPDLSHDQLTHFQQQGYLIVRSLLTMDEVDQLNHHFQRMHDNPPPEYTPKTAEEANHDPLLMYPRVMQPHRFDQLSKHYLLDARLWAVLRQLLGEEPIAAQSMYYFKPPQARGQALHQDNFYLHVKPGTCLAAWVALDDCDEENGGLQVVPNTQNLEVACPEQADRDLSFFEDYVPPPEGAQPVLATMQAGDVLFFNGNVIHGSLPNRSQTRWRRSFICHYMADSDREIAKSYHPLINADGEEVDRDLASGGGPCGTPIES